MQTFLPYASFATSVKVLDYSRLFQQCQDVCTLLKLLEQQFNDPQQSDLCPDAKMWKGAELLLLKYAAYAFDEFTLRTGNPHKSEQVVRDSMFVFLCLDQPCPSWLGDEELHSNHRSRLLFKGELDVLHKRFNVATARGIPHGRYTHTHIRHFTQADFAAANAYLDRQQVPSFANWYRQWGWSEEMSDHKYWPAG